jgi:hypothetical protein
MVQSIWPESNGSQSPLPTPSVVVARAGTPLHELSPQAIKGIVVNPIYTGVGPFPQLVEDEVWVRACAKAGRERRSGAIPRQPAVRPARMSSRGIDRAIA